MQILRILFFLFLLLIFTGCMRFMLSFERHYSSLNYYRRQAKRWNINPTKIPDLRFNGYTKTFIRQQVIDGGPYREEWGYKFESIDSQNTKTEFLMPFVTRE